MSKFEHIIKSPIFSGALLFSAAMLAIIISNTGLTDAYHAWLNKTAAFKIGDFRLEKNLLHWINDGLMVLFFLLVGLEIKRELLRGVLRNRDQVILPLVGALGGLLLPAIIYAIINADDPIAVHGWAIPAATDIAFSLAILALLGSRVPIALKIFLTALAIIDDIGAILIIAVFYTTDLSIASLFSSLLAIIALVILNKMGVKSISPYIVVGTLLWVSVLKSGVHATLAGIILAFAIPINEDKNGVSPLITTEHALTPWVNFVVLPLFAFANSGFSFSGLKLSSLTESIPLGILLGLFLGKQIGIFGSCWLLIKLGYAKLPHAINWAQLYGVAILCGVGFTMSLFIGALAFQGKGPEYATLVRLGVLTGSMLSGIVGYAVIRFFTHDNPKQSDKGLHHL